MATKRLIGVLAVRHGGLVKSYGYSAWRPAGGLVSALRNLDRWAVDEIVVLDISRRAGLDPRVLQAITAAKVTTPLAYGGGIRSVADIRTLLGLGCDRFVVENLLFNDPDEVQAIAALTGRQALVGSVPVRLEAELVSLWRPTGENNDEGSFEPLAAWRDALLASPVSEYLITSVPTQGRAGTFPLGLLDKIGWLPPGSIIAHGGLDFTGARTVLDHRLVTAVAFGNLNHEGELVPAEFRATAVSPGGETLRPIRLS